MPTVSYVVTLFNKRPFVPYLVAGLEAQGGDFRKQFVFVDDGSTDGTREALEGALADRNAAVVVRQENSGQGAALNRGFAAASGDFIKALDGDDMLAPWATQRLLDALSETGCKVARANMFMQPTYDVSIAPGALLASMARAPGETVIERDLLQRSMRVAQMNPSAWLAPRRLIDEIGGCDRGAFISDYSLELRFGLAGPVARVEEPMIWCAARNPSSLSANQAQVLHDVNIILLHFLCEHPELDPDLTRFALKRASGRSWAWARRHGGDTVFSPVCRTYLRAWLGGLRPNIDLEGALCGPFRATSPVRVMGKQ